MDIFVVENSESILERITSRLNAVPGVKVCGQAGTVRQANEQISATHPDAIVLDIQLNDGAGYQVLTKTKAQKNAPIVIVLTNYPYPQYRKKYMDGGADYFFDKSNEFDQAMEVIHALADKKPTAPH